MTRLCFEAHLISSQEPDALVVNLRVLRHYIGRRPFFTVAWGNAPGNHEQSIMFGRRPYSIPALGTCEYGLRPKQGSISNYILGRCPRLRWARPSAKRQWSNKAHLTRGLCWLVLIVMTSGNLAGATPAVSASARHRALQQALEAYSAAMNTPDRDQRLQGFALAEQLFRQVMTGSEQHEGVRNAALYVNLGNAALQAERLGPAILAYRRALLLNPAHAQTRQNLQYARSMLPEWIQRDAASGLADTLFFWRALYAREQIRTAAAICFLVAAMLLAASLLRRQPLLRHLAIVPLLAWFVLIVSVGIGRNDRLSNEAIVIGQELVVHSADSENSPRRLSLPLPSGAEVRITRQRDRWTEIEIEGGRSGWVITSGLERVI